VTDEEFEEAMENAAIGLLPAPPEAGELDAASRWVICNVKKHVRCPCCRQRARMYERKIHSSAAGVLVLLAAGTQPGEFVHVGAFIAGHPHLSPRARAAIRGDYAKLSYWGFIEDSHPAQKPRRGYWRITLAGRQFARGETKAPRAVMIYNERVYGHTTATVTINQALGSKFNYEELVRPWA